MNILKNVVNRIAESDKKTELASQKVELAGVKEIQKAISEYKEAQMNMTVADSYYKSSKKAFDVFEQDWTTFYFKRQNAEDSIKKGKAFDKDLQELQKTAKDLGIDVKQIKGYNELLKLKSDVEKEFSRINKLKYPAK